MGSGKHNGPRIVSSSVPPLRIAVTIFDALTDTVERQTTTDFNDPESRKWLHRTMLWAINNGKVVEILNVKDDDDFNPKLKSSEITHKNNENGVDKPKRRS